MQISKKNDIISKIYFLHSIQGEIRSICMMEVKTRPQMRTIKKEKVICYMLNGKRDYEKEKRVAQLLDDVLKTIE